MAQRTREIAVRVRYDLRNKRTINKFNIKQNIVFLRHNIHASFITFMMRKQKTYISYIFSNCNNLENGCIYLHMLWSYFLLMMPNLFFRLLAMTIFISKLDHPNLVKFYGTAVENENDDVKAILVMELCKGNLEEHFEFYPTTVPGFTDNRKDILQAFKWVIEICSALDYIHSVALVHRDLKLKKILVRNKEETNQLIVLPISI